MDQDYGSYSLVWFQSHVIVLPPQFRPLASKHEAGDIEQQSQTISKDTAAFHNGENTRKPFGQTSALTALEAVCVQDSRTTETAVVELEEPNVPNQKCPFCHQILRKRQCPELFSVNSSGCSKSADCFQTVNQTRYNP